MFSATRRYLRDERGIALVIVAGSMVALLSFAALAIDIGKLTTARTEAQRTADLCAMAGAGGLIYGPNDAAGARSIAIEYAGYNTVIGEAVTPAQLAIDVDLAALTVACMVNRTTGSGSPITTHFARIFGVNDVDIAAYAKAQVVPAGFATCLLPLAVPDRWKDEGGNPEDFEDELGDFYIPYPAAGFTGYSDDDIGTPIRLKEGKGPGTMNPSWYFPWRPPGDRGGADYRANIKGCRHDPPIEYTIGMEVDTEPGNMIGPTKQGFQDLIGQDPSAVWNSTKKCVTSGGSSPCRGSPRIRPVPLFDPSMEPQNGKKPFEITNFAGVFVERMDGNDVWVRLASFAGIPGSGTPAGEFGKAVQLIE